jgi:hypothetical protein
MKYLNYTTPDKQYGKFLHYDLTVWFFSLFAYLLTECLFIN